MESELTRTVADLLDCRLVAHGLVIGAEEFTAIVDDIVRRVLDCPTLGFDADCRHAGMMVHAEIIRRVSE